MRSNWLLWQRPGWPALSFDGASAAAACGSVRFMLGSAEGSLKAIGLATSRQLTADAWADDTLATAAIEGEKLDLDGVRSSVCRRLGIETTNPRVKVPRNVDGLLDVMADAVDNARAPLTDARLKRWQAALFPTGLSGLQPIAVDVYRAKTVRIVSGAVGRERVHYEGPPAETVPAEMARFLSWFETEAELDALVKAALAHLWFETIHPFEDGNGRVGRAVIDLTLARSGTATSRLVRISQQLNEHRGDYYDQLERAQHGPLDVTPWVLWFLAQLEAACAKTIGFIELALAKTRFWTDHADETLNERQKKALRVLLDAGPGGYMGGMSTRKYEALTGTSRATASRELVDLARRGLVTERGAGRSTRYDIAVAGWMPA